MRKPLSSAGFIRITFIPCPYLSIFYTYFVRVYNGPAHTKVIRRWYDDGTTMVRRWYEGDRKKTGSVFDKKYYSTGVSFPVTESMI